VTMSSKHNAAPTFTRRLASFSLAVALAAAAFAAPPAAVPRQSPEFTIQEGSGKRTLLSSFRGKVIVIEFFFLRSPKCVTLAQTLNKLNTELGPRGFQPVAVAFSAPGSEANAPMVNYFADYFKLLYPVGYASKVDVDTYLSRTENEVLNIPQVVVIDRRGIIRTTSGGRGGNPQLESEDGLRRLIDSLLQERPGSTKAN
jgi:peroxiredoxin